MKYYIIAGEASGDLHGSNLVKELKIKDPSAEIRGWGGDLMENEGVTLVKHIRDLAFMGFVEVLMNIRTIRKNLKFCEKDVKEFQPDALILIDYPGFNLRIASFAHKLGLKVYYYISPQVWAWKQSRVHTIKEVVDKMFVILPFEKGFYKQYDYDVTFVGHPLLDAIDQFKKNEIESSQQRLREHGIEDEPLLALLPGSRKQEIVKMLPIMLKVARENDSFQVVVAGAPNFVESDYFEMAGRKDFKVIFGRTYDLLNRAHSALVTSGTATLEAALFKVPQVVCYKGNPISYWIARRIVKVPYISLANLIMNKEISKELIQSELNEGNLRKELTLILDESRRLQFEKEYSELTEVLGGTGASENVANHLLKTLTSA